jgi:hypothetical protein
VEKEGGIEARQIVKMRVRLNVEVVWVVEEILRDIEGYERKGKKASWNWRWSRAGQGSAARKYKTNPNPNPRCAR